jgi:hypothetical protein
MKLPIERLPDSFGQLHFKWTQTVSTPIGKRIVDCEGPLAINAEQAVADLIALAKKLAKENEELRRQANTGGQSNETAGHQCVTV